MAKKKQRKPIREKFEDFLGRLETMVGTPLFRDIEKTFVERPTTFRVNTLRSSREQVLEILKQEGFKVKQIPWYKHAFILENKTKRELTKLPLYEAGHIYIQSLASMVPPIVLHPQAGERVLDLTAAPGSKTSQIAALMQRTGELVANDKTKIRFFKLKHNMEMLGVGSGIEQEEAWQFTLRMEPGEKLAREYDAYFDKILLDAPCSAEARFCENEPRTYAYWNERKIKEMAYAQRKLLFSAWQALRPGGILVYSTCTFAPEENEMQISRFLERTPDARVLSTSIDHLAVLPTLQEWNGHRFHRDIAKTLRIKPTKDIEGFFVATLQKENI